MTSPPPVSASSVDLLLQVIRILNQDAIDYVVIGAFALAAYATVRATTDLGALIDAPPRQLQRLATRLRSEGWSVEMRIGDDTDPVLSMLVILDGQGNRVDLLGGLRGLDVKIFSRARRFRVLEHDLRMVGLEDLIAMKCFAGGPQDLLDARAAFNTHRSEVDVELLGALARRFGRSAMQELEKLLAS